MPLTVLRTPDMILNPEILITFIDYFAITSVIPLYARLNGVWGTFYNLWMQ